MEKAIIIGGSGGIGSEIIKMLKKNNIYVINIDKVPFEQNDSLLKNITCDLTLTDIPALVDTIMKEENEINYFISSIGYYGVKSLQTFSIEEYDKTLKVNLQIPTQFCVELTKNMQKQNGGKLILISSAAAYIGSRDIPYSISKAGMLGLLRAISKNTAGSNIFCYGIAPGIVKTKMSANQSPQRQNDTIERTLNKRMCNPDEIAKTVEFLIVKEEGYMNGSVIHMNNGVYMN